MGHPNLKCYLLVGSAVFVQNTLQLSRVTGKFPKSPFIRALAHFAAHCIGQTIYQTYTELKAAFSLKLTQVIV